MSGLYDTAFADAVWLASRGDGKELAKLLRGGMPINDAEREMLAALVAGDLKPPPGKRRSLRAEVQRAVAVRYLVARAEGVPSDSIVSGLTDDILKQHGVKVSRASVLSWVKTLRAGLARAPDPVAVLEAQHGQPLPDPVAALRAINGQSG